MSKKNAIIFRHLHQEKLGSLEEVLTARGIDYKYFNTAREDFSQIDPQGADLLLIMGGPIGVYQADDYPFLYKVIEAAQKRLKAGLPVFGICLGAQIIARALGAEVYPGKNGKERGWHPIALTEEGKRGPLAHIAPEKTNMFHWHGDTFDLPEGATRLASSEKYQNQAFSWGGNTLGVQFHPEVTESLLQEWFVGLVDEVTGPNAQVPLGPLRAETAKYSEPLKKHARQFFDSWLESIGL